MSCSGCEQTVEDAVLELEGVTEADADREHDRLAVEESVTADAVVAAVEDAGYDAHA